MDETEPGPGRAATRRLDWVRWLLPALLAAWIAQAWLTKHGYDFEVFWTAGRRMLHGEPLYRASDGPMPFKYAPPVALLFVPFALLPQRLSYLCWLVLSAGAVYRLITWSQRVFGGAADGRRELLILVLCTPFVGHLLYLGQCDALLLALAVQSEGVRRRAPAASGLLLAAAVLFKPPYLLFGLLAALRREGRRLVALGLGLLLAAVVTVAVLGPTRAHGETMAWRTLLAETTPGILCGIANQSLPALVCTYLTSDPRTPGFLVAVAVLAVGLLAALAWAIHKVRRGNAELADTLTVAMTFYCTALFSPLGWRTNLLALIPLLALLLSPRPPPLDRRARIWRAVTLGALTVTVLFLNYDVVGLARFQALLDLRMYGLIGLWVAVATTVVTVRRARQPQAMDAAAAVVV